MGNAGKQGDENVIYEDRPFLAVTFTEETRIKTGLVLAIFHNLIGLACLGMGAIGLYMKCKLAEYTNLVTGYHGDMIIYLLLSLGLFGVVVNNTGSYICFSATHPQNRESSLRSLRIYFFFTLICTIYTAVAGVNCFTGIAGLELSFRGGIKAAMSDYRENIILKSELHDLQSRFECCGDQGYTDWFKVLWVKEDYDPEDYHRNETADKERGYYHDDVPYSCCNKFSPRPCINMDVHNNGKHHNYDFTRDLTVYTAGCTERIMDFYGDMLLTNGGAFVFVVFILEVLIALTVKYFYSSIYEALSLGDPQAEVRAYLWKRTVKIQMELPKVSGSEASVPAVTEVDQDPFYHTIPSPMIPEPTEPTYEHLDGYQQAVRKYTNPDLRYQ